MKLSGDIAAVITGGGSGLGEATARALSSCGVQIAIFDLNSERGEAVAAELDGIFCKVDINSEEDVDSAFARARNANGQERILVNCAGIGGPRKTVSRNRETGKVSHYPLEAFASIINTNLIGTFRCIAKSAAGMVSLSALDSGEKGAIVNTASVAATDGQVGQAGYAASKAGIVGMTLPIARDLMGEGIRINTILPGIFDTPLMMNAPQQIKDALAASVPFPKRFGVPEEFASLALEICRNSYFNGENVRLDGAIRMPPR